MEDRTHERPPEGEPIDRSRPREEVGPRGEGRREAGAPLWLWLIPLVLVVIGLTWYIFTQGEPASPFGAGGAGVRTPEPEAPGPVVETPTLEVPTITTPREDPPAASPPAAPAEPAPAEEGPAAEETATPEVDPA